MSNFRNLLIVDDEINVLNSLKRLFISEDINLHVALGANKAIEVLKSNIINIILSDYKMPEMNGIELLEYVKHNYPETFRAILSGYVETDAITNAIGKGTAMAYFKKPWSEYNITEKINHIFETLDVLHDEQLVEIFNKIDKLPSIPDIYHEIEDAINNNKSIDTICNIIKKDISLTAKILQIGNSVFYGTKGYAGLEQIVVMIGLESIKDIVLVYKMSDNLTQECIEQAELSNIFRCGLLLNKAIDFYINDKSQDKKNSKVSNVGLLSYIGRIILLVFYKERYFKTRSIMSTEKISFLEAEHLLGYINNSSSSLAGYFLDLYNMPFEMVDIILNNDKAVDLPMDLKETAYILNHLSRAIDIHSISGEIEIADIKNDVIDQKKYLATLEFLKGVFNV